MKPIIFNIPFEQRAIILKHPNIEKVTMELQIFENILERNNCFINLIVCYDIEEINSFNYSDTTLLFFDKNSLEEINLKKLINYNNLKTFMIVDEINNDLFKISPNEFIVNPTNENEEDLIEFLNTKIINFQKIKDYEINNKKIVVQQKKTDELFELLSNNSLITKTDKHGRIIYANDIFLKTTGFEKAEVLGLSHNIIKHEKTTDTQIKNIWEKLSKKEVWNGVLRNKTKNGNDLIVDTKIIPELDIDRKVIGYLSVQYDITDLVHKNELAELLMNEQSNAILIGQIGKGVINASNEFLRQFNLEDAKTLKNKKCNILELAELENQESSKLEKFKRNESVTLNNLKIKLSEEENKIFDVVQKRIITPFGKYFIITLNDVTTSQKEVAEARNEANVKSNFLATMSHEIRTPLNGMIPYIDLLLESSTFSKEQMEYITTIKNSSEGLLRIINDVLDFSKIESGKLEIENISFDPLLEFETVIELYVAKADEKNISLFTYIEPTLPILIGDSLRIKQIFNNFLSNAIKFTPVNGEIIILVEITKNLNDENRAAISISVEDNGKGITEEQQENIFKPFSQADNSISRKYGGTGLGLSISNDLAKMMGGSITLNSKVNSGSKFKLDIELDIDIQNPIDRFSNKIHHKIGVYSLNEELYKCQILLLCKYLKAMNFQYKKITNLDELDSCEVIFVISSGKDEIEQFDEYFTKNIKVITILGSNIQNMNKFHSSATINMPINGSKIYDAIVDIERLYKQKEYVLKRTNVVEKYNAKILIAEDSPTNQNLVKTLMSKHGIDVDIADNGKIALEYFIKNRTENNESIYELIYLDIHMPIMDGLEAISKMREYEKDNNLEPKIIVALTADAIKKHQQLYLESGFDEFLAKPIERERFEFILSKYLNHRRKELSNQLINPVANKEIEKIDEVDKRITLISEELGLDYETSKVLLDDFMDNWKDYKIKLEKAIDGNNHLKIKEISHSLKGASGSLMLNDIFERFKEIERIARENKPENNEMYKEIFRELSEII